MKWNYCISFCFFYRCLLVVHPTINSILCYDPLVMSKFFEIKTKFICHLNMLSWLNINLHLFCFIVSVGNKNSFDAFIGIMRSIKIWIKDIYELDNFETTWKSSNIYSLPRQVFFMFLFNVFHYLICKYWKIFWNNITRRWHKLRSILFILCWKT